MAGVVFGVQKQYFKELLVLKKVTPGYMGGTIKNPTYKEICTGETGHVEVVEVFYDDKKLLVLKLFFYFF